MIPPTDAEIRAACRFAKSKGRALRKAQKERALAPPVDPTLSERDAVTAKAVDLLNNHPLVLLAWKQTVGKMRGAGGKSYTVGAAGLGDVCFLLKRAGGFGSLEVKRPDVRASFSQAQMDMALELQVNGYIAGTITKAEQAVEIVKSAHFGGR